MSDRELALETLRPIMIGNEVTRVEGHPGGWTFHLQNECFVNVGCPWRLFESGKFRFSGSDHDQKFGSPKPFNVVEQTNQTLKGKKLRGVSIAEEAADLMLSFENNIRVEVLQDSGGYEAWNVKGPDGIFIVAMGGGELAIWTKRS